MSYMNQIEMLGEPPIVKYDFQSINSIADHISGSAAVLQRVCFGAAQTSGWWTNLATGDSYASKIGEPVKINIPEKLMLVVSEVAEAMEGTRKNLMDDKLPHRSMLEVELADTVIRCFDLAGGLDLDLAGALTEKLLYNAQRADHKLANRQAEGGKKF